MILSSSNRTHLCLSTRRRQLFSDASLNRPRDFAFSKRRRLKRRPVALRCQFDSPSFDELFKDFPLLNFLVPATLGLASVVGLNWKRKFDSGADASADVGEWVLFTSPTPFNRFVFFRCPSVSFGEELIEDLNERLVKEDRHFVRLNSGRMMVSVDGVERGTGSEFEYQRICVRAEDGGVISLDWPANLKLEEEHGLDTTMLVVPGTVEGSMDGDVLAFVREALRRGLFPVVMNPRGCAASPLTTARLFTAADSDDISTAVQFINEARPWTTLMGVGWGYGANMLAKYLTEAGDQTPLTAATCIDNPFDLEELTRLSPYHRALDQRLASGLVNILRSNKELFQGRDKGFHVDQALSAKSVREFEKAISMVSYGFKDIKDFYSAASTRALVGNVKIPVLFIQNNDGAVPMFSIPRDLIAENPFTSLLICSCSQSKASVSWYQYLTIEWLTAVELGLLKGRHPLLKDVDVTINPSKGLAFVEGRTADKDRRVKKLLNLSQSKIINDYSINSAGEILKGGETAVGVQHHYGGDLDKMVDSEDKELQLVQNGSFMQTNSIEANLVKDDDPADGERGHVLQTAQVVMNMLDVSMPGTLREDEKKKVLAAVSQGETVMKALQDAVPEDVRGKLTDAVSVIMHAQGINLKQGIGKVPSMSGSKSRILEKVESAQNEIKGVEKSDVSDSKQAGNDPSGGAGSEIPPSENANKSDSDGQSQPHTCQQSGISSSDMKDANESVNDYDNHEFTKEKASTSDSCETDFGTSGRRDFTSQDERAGSSDVQEVTQDGGIVHEVKEDNNSQLKEEKTLDSSDQNKMTSASTAEAAVSSAASSTDSQPVEGEQNDNQKKENQNQNTGNEPNKSTASDSSAPSFSVSAALDALTGMDDSTQVAVNSVFGVIENMIAEMEGKDDEDEAKGGDGVKDQSVGPSTEKSHTLKEKEDGITYQTSEKKEVCGADYILGNEIGSKTGIQKTNSDELYIHEDTTDAEEDIRSASMVKAFTQNYKSADRNDGDDSDATKLFNGLGLEERRVSGKLAAANHIDRLVHTIPLYVNVNPYAGTLLSEYSHHKYVLSSPSAEPLDIDTTTALLLDYFPEEGQWKLLEQSGSVGDSFNDATTSSGTSRESMGHSAAGINETDTYIEPSYVILDTERQQEPLSEYEFKDNVDGEEETVDDRLEELMKFVKNIILDSLRVEVNRKLSSSDMKEMGSQVSRDLDKVATAVSLAIGQDQEHICYEGKGSSVDCSYEKVGSVRGESIIRAISSTVPETSYLRRVLPVGVIVGSSFAAMRRHFHVFTVNYSGQMEDKVADKTAYQRKAADKTNRSAKKKTSVHKTGQNVESNNPTIKEGLENGLKNLDHDNVLVGAVTAAIGASAFFSQKEGPLHSRGTSKSSSQSLKEKVSQHKEDEKFEDEMDEKHENNIVTSLAEKAISVAAPVVPTKEDGEVDQERLVAMLTELGHRGGMLRLFGKIALLWGGIRGAMSLTDKLIMFLHIGERPLFQRILAFSGMVLVLWSPVVIPLLPALVQGWTVNNPSRTAELACIVGFYSAVMILVFLWGKRIRGYENPLEEYGLDLAFPLKIKSLCRGLVGGVLLVTLIQSINVILGSASFSSPLGLPSSSMDFMIWLKFWVKLILLVVRGILTATGVVVVEELLFRSWLPEEIAADLGYHQGIILSGLAFSFFQRSLQAIPGLWAISLALAGLRQRNGGSLSIPVGFRVGIMASSFILQTGGFLIYKPNFHHWVTGTHLLQPFGGIIGLAFSMLLAIVLYPREPLQKKKPKKTMQD